MSGGMPERVAVIGAGTMGQGIAQTIAHSGIAVQLYDSNPEQVNRALMNLDAAFDYLVSKGKISVLEKTTCLERIQIISKISDIYAQLIIEAVVESEGVKLQIFQELESILDSSVIITSNTSAIPITRLAGKLKNPERFAGLHFFNPAPIMKLVEIVQGVRTAESTMEMLLEFVKQIGKVPVVCKDSPGFIVNRVARQYYVESLLILEEKVLGIKETDELMRATGFKMGPFELMDLIGVDVNFAVTSGMHASFFGSARFRPSRIQQQLVDAGKLGRKTGSGFYEYS